MSDLGNKKVMAENIQRLMAAHAIDRNKLASDLNLKYTTLSDWINGKTYPRIDKIEMMARYFGVQKADLVEKYDPSKNEAADVIAAHIDDDTSATEQEQIINFIEALKKARNQD